MTQLPDLSDREEIQRFADAVESHRAGHLDSERFTAVRLQHGVYGQRQEGLHMLRVKVPGGRLDPLRLRAIADVVQTWASEDAAHVTTRQDIQIHYVPLDQAAPALLHLAEAGLTTREACGNTVRNVTACPLAGACPREHTDVNEHLGGAVAHFLRNPLNQQLPRKFKISFSGCESDCAQARIHDLGVVAVREGDRFGFRVTAGGGLGHKPREAIVIEPFIVEDDLLPLMEAIIAVHNRHSDRTKRAKSRIKFLVERFGAEQFVVLVREEFARARAALADAPRPRGIWHAGRDVAGPGPGAPRAPYAQRQVGLFTFPVAVPLGQLTAAGLRGLAGTMEALGLTDVRTTQDQNLMILGVPAHLLGELRARLAAEGFSAPTTGDNVVACPGTSTCRLGITSSTVLGPKLSGGKHDLRIRVSGCHNGCAQPETGDIGIYGEGRRLHGRLVPHYQTYFGGDGQAGGAIAFAGPSVPAARIEEAVARVKAAYDESRLEGERFFDWSRRQGAEFFNGLLADLTGVTEAQLASVLHDHGSALDFKVLQLGGGECAGASQVQIGADFFEAAHERNYRDALLLQRKPEEALRCAEAILRVIGQGLVKLRHGRKGATLADIAGELDRIFPGPVAERYAGLTAELGAALADPATADLPAFFRAVDAWTVDAADLCQSLNPRLDLGETLPRGAKPAAPARGRPARSVAA